jgi:hypothetical protein
MLMLYFGLFLIYFLSLINFNFVEVKEEIKINICLFFFFLMVLNAKFCVLFNRVFFNYKILSFIIRFVCN